MKRTFIDSGGRHILRKWSVNLLCVLPLLFAGFVATATLAQEESETDPMAVARGAKSWEQHCNRCHYAREIDELTDSEWDVSVTHMRLIGNIPGEVARDIQAFLKSSN